MAVFLYKLENLDNTRRIMPSNYSNSGNFAGNVGKNNTFRLVSDGLEIIWNSDDMFMTINGENVYMSEEDRQRLQKSGLSAENGVVKIDGKVIYYKKNGGKMKKKKKNGCCSIS